jgi:hypothetical protein
MSPDQELGPVLDRFPAFQLHSTWRLVRALIPLAEVEQDRKLKPLERVSLNQLAQQGLLIAQVQEAAEVLHAVHKAIHLEADTSAGISALRVRAPKVSVDGFLIGLSSIPLQQIDEDLSKREHSSPQNMKANIHISHRGIRISESFEPVIPLGPTDFTCLRLIYAGGGSLTGRLTLKKITVGLGLQDTSNTLRSIRTINNGVVSTLKLKYPLIKNNSIRGYFLDNQHYNFQMD